MKIATLVSEAGASATYQLGDARFQFVGTGFTYASIGGKRYLTGGTIDSIRMTNADGSLTLFYLNEISIAGSAFHTALRADETGSNLAALENLFQTLTYTIYGTDQVENFTSAWNSGDGVPLAINLNNAWNLMGGNDFVTAGSGQDSMWGGAGNDNLSGGAGNDQIHGDLTQGLQVSEGTDLLYGQDGNDTLWGGALPIRFMAAPARIRCWAKPAMT